MKRKLVISLIVLLIVIGIPVVASADFTDDIRMIASEFLTSAEEQNDVLSTMDDNLQSIQQDFSSNYLEWGLSSENDIPVKIGAPYKVYDTKADWVKSFYANQEFSKCYSQDYVWEVPLIDKEGQIIQTAKVAFFEGKWQPVIIGRELSLDCISFSSNPKEINNSLERAEVKGIIFTKHIRTMMPRIDLIYIKSLSGEFLIPMSTRPDLFPEVSMMKVYKASELMDLIKDKYPSREVNANNLMELY